MSEIEVRIVRLEPFRAASFYGFGEYPELVAYEKLMAWAGPRGLFEDRESHRIFGFNNPSPSPGSPNYGYEFWITVDPDFGVDDSLDIDIKQFRGGLYAVTNCVGIENIGKMWEALSLWVENSKFGCGHHQWLEENLSQPTAEITEDILELDLYLPISD